MNRNSWTRAGFQRPAVVVIAVVAAVAFTACGAGERASDLIAVRDSAGIPIVENRADAIEDVCTLSPEPLVDIGALEGEPEYQLYRVFDAVTLSDGRIAVVNQGSSEIRVYDERGRFLYAFGGEGGGPGEFRNVFQIWRAAGDTLVVGDYRPWRFSYFTREGEYIRQVVPRPEYVNPPRGVMGVMADGSFVLGTEASFNVPERGFEPRTVHVLRHASDGALVDTIGTFSAGRQGWLSMETRFYGTPLFEPTTRFAAARRTILVGRGLEREVEVRDADGTVLRLVRWTGDYLTVGSEDVAAHDRGLRERYADDPDAWRMFGEPSLSDNRPVNDRFPAHASIRLGLEGDIWVHEYPRPADDGPAPWLVFEPDGGFQCHAVLPEGMNIYEIGRDRMLVMQRDELDVEHVRVYGLDRPSRADWTTDTGPR